jgi:branched-chain amino acid aminotransferase
MSLVWIDGSLVDGDTAAVSPFDHGITVGDGVFETLEVTDGRPFAMRRHLARLRRSAAGLGLEVPVDDARLCDAAAQVVTANRMTHARLRITVTGGVAPLGSDRGGARPTVIVAVAPLPAWPPTCSVATVPWRRNEHGAVAGLKTTSYAENVVALAEAHRRGADEAIFANTAGELCEGTGSNVFLGREQRLWTPPLSSGCLAGITRELVLELVPVVEAPLPLDALAEADEAFITSSTRDIQPVAVVDGHVLPAAPGPLTIRATEAFAALRRRTLDP